MNSVYLVSCVAVKLRAPAEARDLYVSPWFRKARRYVEQQHSPWYILSAKYGLIDPRSVIEPYNETLNSMRVAARAEWSKRVLGDLARSVSPGDKVVFLAGERYREGLLLPLQSLGAHVEIPMKGLTIGRQLQWLDQHTSA